MKEGKIRFNTVFGSDATPSDAKLLELKQWCEKFQKNGLTPEVEGTYTGNLSFRSNEGFIITASGLRDKENLTDDSFVYVKSYDEKTNTFIVEGKKRPSSESIMHYRLYKANNEVDAVFHGHSNIIVANAKKLDLPITEKEYESGTPELATEVTKGLGNNAGVVLKNHGFVTVGKTMKQAGDLALDLLNRSKTEN
ncbi:MAG: class II aldolase/adducin family protein [Candidatus Bathyarchaeia archaeon]|jgi:ribulose-5-phosphate 4-epimerase/fuculose-1-phosphate aldolase